MNSDRLLDNGRSEIRDLVPLVDALNKLLADMLVASEFLARPRRWATGIELVEGEEIGEASARHLAGSGYRIAGGRSTRSGTGKAFGV